MPHDVDLIILLAVGFGVALFFGYIAARLRLPPLIGYLIAGIIITLLPLGDTLPVAGQNMIAILVFAIIVWISEAMDYTASAIVISALIIFMVGFAPDMNHPDTILGTAKALKMTLSGFSNSALALVAAAMFIAAAMTITGLDKITFLACTPKVLLVPDTLDFGVINGSWATPGKIGDLRRPLNLEEVSEGSGSRSGL